jgi:hypothetical protein
LATGTPVAYVEPRRWTGVVLGSVESIKAAEKVPGAVKAPCATVDYAEWRPQRTPHLVGVCIDDEHPSRAVVRLIARVLRSRPPTTDGPIHESLDEGRLAAMSFADDHDPRTGHALCLGHLGLCRVIIGRPGEESSAFEGEV